MSWNISGILLLLTLAVGIVSSLRLNDPQEILTKNTISEETKKFLINTTVFDTIQFRKLHIDEESPKSLADDSNEGTVDVNDLKYEVEILQPGRIEKEDLEIEERFKGPSLNFDTNEFFEENIEVNAETIQQGHFILTIALCALALISVGVCAGLLVWRANLEKRYGMRQRLMTEDDFCANIHDTRPF